MTCLCDFCSLPEQQEIVRLLDEQFEGIEREIDGALRSSEALRQAILQKAFTGRLVPQDPSDEPASSLLARLPTGEHRGDSGQTGEAPSQGRHSRMTAKASLVVRSVPAIV